MLKILLRKWNENKSLLRQELSTRTNLNGCNYLDLVKLTFETIYNKGELGYGKDLDLDNITQIDNGDYQGTLLFLIPFNIYQPSEYEYLMTYVGYGSCSGCDTLLSIQEYNNGQELTEQQVKLFMNLCKDIVTNTIKPYNSGWRENDNFDVVKAGE